MFRKIDNFRLEIPARNPRLLGPEYASEARNVKVWSGKAAPWRRPADVQQVRRVYSSRGVALDLPAAPFPAGQLCFVHVLRMVGAGTDTVSFDLIGFRGTAARTTTYHPIVEIEITGATVTDIDMVGVESGETPDDKGADIDFTGDEDVNKWGPNGAIVSFAVTSSAGADGIVFNCDNVTGDTRARVKIRRGPIDLEYDDPRAKVSFAYGERVIDLLVGPGDEWEASTTEVESRGARTIFKAQEIFANDAADGIRTDWFQWLADVDVLLGPVANTARKWIYSGDGAPKITWPEISINARTTLTVGALEDDTVLTVAEAGSFIPGHQVEVTLNDDSVFETTVVDVDTQARTITVDPAITGDDADAGNAVVNAHASFPQGWYYLGVPAPADKPDVARQGTSGTVIDIVPVVENDPAGPNDELRVEFFDGGTQPHVIAQLSYFAFTWQNNPSAKFHFELWRKVEGTSGLGTLIEEFVDTAAVNGTPEEPGDYYTTPPGGQFDVQETALADDEVYIYTARVYSEDFVAAPVQGAVIIGMNLFQVGAEGEAIACWVYLNDQLTADPAFELSAAGVIAADDDNGFWENVSTDDDAEVRIEAGQGFNGNNCLKLTRAGLTGNAAALDLTFREVLPGDAIHFRGKVKRNAAFAGTPQFFINLYDEDQVFLAAQAATINPSDDSVYEDIAKTITLNNADVRFIRVGFRVTTTAGGFLRVDNTKIYNERFENPFSIERGDKISITGVVGMPSANTVADVSEVAGNAVLCDITPDTSQEEYEYGGVWTLELGDLANLDDQTQVQTRSYVYTYVALAGTGDEITEMEGPPSDPSNQVDVIEGEGVLVSGLLAPPERRNIRKIRVYRTVPTSGDETTFFFVAEIELPATEYLDEVPSLETNEPIESIAWDPPPEDLRGLTAMPNGMTAGFRDNEEWFAEPFQPHAWPSDFMQRINSRIVANAVYGETLVALTTAEPRLFIGASPEEVSHRETEILQPCTSKRGVFDMGAEIGYPTPDGIGLIGPGRATIVTVGLFTVDQWRALRLDTMVASRYDQMYALTFEGKGGKPGMLLIDPAKADGEIGFIDYIAQELWSDIDDGTLYLVEPDADMIQLWDAGPLPFFMRWRSGEIVFPRSEAPQVALVQAAKYPVMFRIFGRADGSDLLVNMQVTSDEAFAVAAIERQQRFYVEVAGTNEVEFVAFASSIDDLREGLGG